MIQKVVPFFLYQKIQLILIHYEFAPTGFFLCECKRKSMTGVDGVLWLTELATLDQIC